VSLSVKITTQVFQTLSDLKKKYGFVELGLAVSGGSDSLAMLYLCKDWAVKNKIKLRCVTVDHKLRSESLIEAELVAGHCKKLGINHEIVGWDHEEKLKGNLSDLARSARYRIIDKWRKNINFVLVGHTQNDQVETFFMNLKRGSGIEGLKGMPVSFRRSESYYILRPLIHTSRESLQQYLKEKNITWVSDPSNSNEDFERISQRKTWTILKSKGFSENRIELSADHMRRAHEALNHMLPIHFKSIGKQEITDLLWEYNSFVSLPEEFKLRLISAVVMWNGNVHYRPRFKAVLDVLKNINEKKTVVLGGSIFYYNAGKIRITIEYQSVKENTISCTSDLIWRNIWKVEREIKDGYITAIGIDGNKQLSKQQRSTMPFRSRIIQPGIFVKEKLLIVPTLDSDSSEYLSFCGIKFNDFLHNH
jgi:tRNA(Ile)-lysidine synthase